MEINSFYLFGGITFLVEEAQEVNGRRICPICYGLGHGNETQAIHQYFDCKNLFIDENRNVVGQCNCACQSHGRR